MSHVQLAIVGGVVLGDRLSVSLALVPEVVL